MALAMNESNRPVLADLFVFPSATGSTGALLATAALPAAWTVATRLAAAATLLAATLAALLATAALSATGAVAALLAAALPAALVALGNQFVQVIVSIIESVSAIPNLWSFHGVFLFAEESSA
jgi:hypothetical protein